MSYCSNCGNKIPEGAKFCTNCGAPVKVIQPRPAGTHDAAPSRQRRENKKRKKKWPLVLIICLFICIFIAAAAIIGIAVMPSHNSKNDEITEAFSPEKLIYEDENFSITLYSVESTDELTLGSGENEHTFEFTDLKLLITNKSSKMLAFCDAHNSANNKDLLIDPNATDIYTYEVMERNPASILFTLSVYEAEFDDSAGNNNYAGTYQGSDVSYFYKRGNKIYEADITITFSSDDFAINPSPEPENSSSPDLNINSFRGDLSWVFWYIQQNFSSQTLNETKFYEIWDAEEEMVLAILPGGDGTHQYILFDYNGGVADWYLYNHDVYEMESWSLTESNEDSQTEQLTVINNPDMADLLLYVHYNAAKQVEYIVYQWGDYGSSAFIYEYQNGLTSAVDYYDSSLTISQEELAQIPDSISDSYQCQYQYQYSQAGNLEKIVYVSEDGTAEDYWSYEYDGDGNRTTIINDEYGESAQYTYSSDGRISSVSITSEWEELDNYSIDVTFYADGTVSYNKR